MTWEISCRHVRYFFPRSNFRSSSHNFHKQSNKKNDKSSESSSRGCQEGASMSQCQTPHYMYNINCKLYEVDWSANSPTITCFSSVWLTGLSLSLSFGILLLLCHICLTVDHLIPLLLLDPVVADHLLLNRTDDGDPLYPGLILWSSRSLGVMVWASSSVKDLTAMGLWFTMLATELNRVSSSAKLSVDLW